MRSEPRSARTPVWPLSISLAATLEIDKFSFSSSGYLDVSVPRVPHVQLCIHCTLTEVSSAGFPHSDISGSLDLSAKASTLRPYYFNRSRNDRISWFSVSSLMYSVTSAGFVFFSFSYLVINDEIWISLMSWLISISENEFYLNSCMKFSRYIRVSETISCIFDTSGLIDHAIQECLFLDRIIDKSKTLL